MVKFVFGGYSYRIIFEDRFMTVQSLKKARILSANHKGSSEFRRTMLAKIQVEVDGKFKTLSQGISVCSPRDRFSLSTGRRLAVKYAISAGREGELHNLFTKDLKYAISAGREGELHDLFTKDFSLAMWEAYFSTLKERKVRKIFVNRIVSCKGCY